MHSEKVPYYILDLLQQVPSVYVAGLGRFDAIFHPAVVDISRSQIRPPRVEPGFNASAQDVEEILPMYMHYVSGKSITEATTAIRAFAEDILDRINNGSSYSINSFGTFSKSSNGIIHFTPDWDAFNLSFTGLEVIDIDYIRDEPSSHTDTHQEDSVDMSIPAASEVTYQPQSDTNWVTDRENPNPENVEAETTTASSGPSISDSTSRLWWTILASALFLITMLCAYLAWDIVSNRDRINQYIAITNDSIATNSPDIVFVDTFEFIEEPIIDDTLPVEEPITEEPTPQVIADPCYVVVGAFSDEKNVIKMEERLSGLGYTSKQIKGGSLTRVAIETNCDKANLQKTLTDARSSINPEAWIY